MTSYSSQKNISSCEKCMQILKNILKFSPFPPRLTDGRSCSSRSPPHRHHQSIKPTRNMTPKLQNRRKMDGLDGGKSSSFIKIQGTDDKDIERVDDVNRYESTRTSELEVAVTNLMVSDYIKNFHERNKHEAVSLVLLPPPRLVPMLALSSAEILIDFS
ncbi:hypothetical protein Tco_0339835 [Tanacetum coccineum]